MFKRIRLFLITNLAIVSVLSIVLNLLGFSQMLYQQRLKRLFLTHLPLDERIEAFRRG